MSSFLSNSVTASMGFVLFSLRPPGFTRGRPSLTAILAIPERQDNVDCPICRHENQPGSKFCANCGNSLQVTCPVCSSVSPADANFCSNCGHRFAAAQPGPGGDVTRYVPPEMLTKISEVRATNHMRGERRTVTMLFADIQGSTAAAEGLDPEDWTEIINGAFEHLIQPVYRYEGTLARLLGDAVLAFFGAPIAHEDDPIRAVRAGLEIVDAMRPYKENIGRQWGIPIDVRVGINTGLVVVGEVGSDLRVEYTALGDAVNVAARMEQTAEPGTVRVTADTWALVSGHFHGEEIGPVEVRGKSEPVEAFRVVELRRDDTEVRAARPLVGRTDELAWLASLRTRLSDGSGWIASIMGEAGLGKSRMLEVFHAATAEALVTATTVEADGELAWLSSVSESYDAKVPYSSMRQLLRRWWGLERSEDPYEVVTAVVGEVVPDVADAAAYLGFMVDVPLPDSVLTFLDRLEPPVLDARVRHAVSAYLKAEASRRPVMLAIEDVHWADPMSLALIEEVMRVTETEPIGLILTMRPYRDEPSWHLHEVAQRDHPHRYELLELTTLPAEAAEGLLEALLDGSHLAQKMRQRILERSDGNPLFIEQMVYAIREHEGDADELRVPTGLTSLLTARLDRLDPESRTVAQFASVIGTDFDRNTLAALLGSPADLADRLTDLLRREILVERGRPNVLGFNHALMREAAYSTILLRTRRDLHRRLADYLVEAHPDAVQEIALHYGEAGDLQEAFPYLIAAGEQASRAMALSDAIHSFATALENLPLEADPELTVRAHEGLGVAYSLLPDLTQSEASFQRLADYADRIGRPSVKVTALNRLAMTTGMLGGDLATAHRYLDDAYAIALEAGDEMGIAEYHMNACTIAGMGGDVAASVEHDAETARWGKQLGVEEIRVEGLVRMAENMVWLMDFERVGPAVEEAFEAARAAGDELNLAILDSMVMSRLRLRDGDTAGALQLLLDSEDTLVKYASFFASITQSITAFLMSGRGDIESAFSHLHRARQTSIAGNMNYFLAVASAGLAQIHSLLGMRTEMEAARLEALEAVRAPLGEFLASTVWAELGLAAYTAGDLANAAGAFEEGLASSSASKYWEKPRLLIGRARVQAAQGETAPAHISLDEAQTFLLDKEMSAFDAHLEHARAETFLAEGKPEEAATRLSRAWQAAVDSGWRVLGVEIAGLASQVAAELGDTDAARRYLAMARSEVEEVSEAITDPQLREAMRSALSAPLDRTAAS